MNAQHPFYPLSLQLPQYEPNTLGVAQILLRFFGVCAVIAVVALLLATRYGVRSVSDRWTLMWFLLCGCIHTFFEGYFVTHHKNMASDLSVFGQTWKEYAMSDSRYLHSDATVLGIEAITAFLEGPACFIAAWAILTAKNYRHAYQLLISTGQLYGCVLYYFTTGFDGFKDSHPHPQYFWGYFVGMNSPWIVIPLVLIVQSVRAMNRAFDTPRRKKQ